ncbi:hypothetical protein [Novosphingobium sp. Gsoil 351]|uniref:hypothetical protein n=1 Tax=Novosphingobium sp. Gsoil 351 TaxID=2675225 RepID=UPI0012B4E396|nr:hypothetical protein [Novosphingobium sp. Gsoil 351]QGN53386.1 hypothetical protein GKE62_01280 [Novosphingobium sp. Gsoil 351]
MATTLLLAGLMLAQSAPAITVEAQPGLDQVGYQALSAGRPDLAIERISADPVMSASDPAALINLGTAYARTGDRTAALARYKAALTSRDRYDLELADGRWLDSRAAARLAILMLERGKALALR